MSQDVIVRYPKDEIAVFDLEAIRDTAVHNSISSDNSQFHLKTIVISNGLNQTVTLQVQGSRDNSTWINIGSTFDVAASTNTYQTSDTFFPFMRITAICSVAPASGTLSAWFELLGG